MPDVVSPDLKKALKRLKLSPILATLPERLIVAREKRMPHQDFLELVFADEIQRRDQIGAQCRATKAGLDRAMTLDAWDSTSSVSFDRDLWAEVTTLRFMEKRHHVLLLGPVGVGKTFLANALGDIACRRGCSVLMSRTDKLLRRLKAARLDQTYEQEMRRAVTVDLLILDDFGLDRLDATESRDVYDIILERNGRASMVVTSNRTPEEWIATMADPLHADNVGFALRSVGLPIPLAP